MDKVEHGKKTIKGQIDSQPILSSTASSGKDIWRITVHATDNVLYNIMTMQNCDVLHKNFDRGHYVICSGNHQTVHRNEDEIEEIVFARITRWEPSIKVTSEIRNALDDICGKLLNAELDIQEKLDTIEVENPIESQLQQAVISDAFHRHLLCLQILNHECRPLTDGNDVKLIYDGQENIYKEVEIMKTTRS